MKYTYPLIAINIDASTVLLYNREEVINFIKNNGAWHNHHRFWNSWYDSSIGMYVGEYYTNEWIVRDDRGRKVDHRDFTDIPMYRIYNKRMKEIRDIGAQGLPIPNTGKRKWHRHSAPRKKNGGSGMRNRNRAKAIYEAKEHGVKNNIGNRVIPWEGYE